MPPAQPSTSASPAFTAEVGARARHGIARRLLPFLFVLYVANYLDRANLAYAALEMSHDLGFSDRVFGIGAGIFFAGYIALQIPGALLVERWSARRWIGAIMILWGALTVLTAAVHKAPQLYAARFFLGIAEAGFFPGIIVYLTHWFVYEDRAKAVGRFMAAIPISFVIGSPLAGALLGVHWFGMPGWRWLFVLEGMPAVLLGITTLLFLPDRPLQARWLSDDERRWITDRLEQEYQAKSSVSSYSVWQALRHPPVILLALVVLFDYTAFYGFIFWFPTILKRLSSMSDFHVGLLGSLPYIAGLVGMQVNGWHSDRTCERRWHTALAMFLGAAALTCLALSSPGLGVTLALFTLMGISVTACMPPFWAMPGALLSKSAAAASIGFINLIGSLGGFIGPYAVGYLYTSTGSFKPGLAYLIAGSAMGGILTLFARERRASTGPAHEALT
jgi:ACS family tartrate transporter-like MFS transporter